MQRRDIAALLGTALWAGSLCACSFMPAERELERCERLQRAGDREAAIRACDEAASSWGSRTTKAEAAARAEQLRAQKKMEELTAELKRKQLEMEKRQKSIQDQLPKRAAGDAGVKSSPPNKDCPPGDPLCPF